MDGGKDLMTTSKPHVRPAGDRHVAPLRYSGRRRLEKESTRAGQWPPLRQAKQASGRVECGLLRFVLGGRDFRRDRGSCSLCDCDTKRCRLKRSGRHVPARLAPAALVVISGRTILLVKVGLHAPAGADSRA